MLNYKGLDYRTEWLTHPEIAPKLKDLSVNPPHWAAQHRKY